MQCLDPYQVEEINWAAWGLGGTTVGCLTTLCCPRPYCNGCGGFSSGWGLSCSGVTQQLSSSSRAVSPLGGLRWGDCWDSCWKNQPPVLGWVLFYIYSRPCCVAIMRSKGHWSLWSVESPRAGNPRTGLLICCTAVWKKSSGGTTQCRVSIHTLSCFSTISFQFSQKIFSFPYCILQSPVTCTPAAAHAEINYVGCSRNHEWHPIAVIIPPGKPNSSSSFYIVSIWAAKFGLFADTWTANWNKHQHLFTQHRVVLTFCED